MGLRMQVLHAARLRVAKEGLPQVLCAERLLAGRLCPFHGAQGGAWRRALADVGAGQEAKVLVGSAELAVLLEDARRKRLAEAVGAGAAASGETLRANHLKMLSDGLILQSQATLYRSALATDPDLDALIRGIGF